MTVEELLREYGTSREQRVRDELIKQHAGLVRFFAARFPTGGGISSEDLVQVGYIGLIAAIDGYDPEYGNRFVTYAAVTIVGTIKRYLRDHTWGLKVPRRLVELGLTLRKIAREEEARLGRPATLAELAVRTGVGEERIAEAMELDRAYRPLSLDAPRMDDPTGEPGGGWESFGAEDPGLLAVDSREAVRGAIGALNEREQRIIRERFFGEASQAQVAEGLGVSQMQVSRLERQALRQLRRILEHGEQPRSDGAQKVRQRADDHRGS